MTYTEAIKKALAGDESGFNFLYNATKTDKYYLALKYVKDRETAEDVLQESYIKAWKKLDTVEPEKFEPWFAQIVANTAKNVLEKKKHTALDLRADVNEDEEPDDVYDRAIDSWENMPELSYTKKETAELVHELLDELPDEQRIVLLLHEIEGLSLKQIAEALECPEETVKSRLRYGKNKIKDKAEALQKKGYKLYGIAPAALLVMLIENEQKAFGAEASTQAALGKCADYVLNHRNVTASGNIAKTAAPSAIDSAASGNIAAAAAKTAFMATKAGRIVIGVIAAAVVGGAAAGIAGLNSDKASEDNAAQNDGTYEIEITTSAGEETSGEEYISAEETSSEYDTTVEETSSESEIADEGTTGSSNVGDDPFFNYAERFDPDVLDSYGGSGDYNSVGLEHVAEFTGEKIETLDEDMKVDSVKGYIVLNMLLYRESAARAADFFSSGNAYTLSPIDQKQIENGTMVHVDGCITMSAKHVWGVPASSYTVTVYKVTYDGVTGYVLQSAFNGSPADVNPAND